VDSETKFRFVSASDDAEVEAKNKYRENYEECRAQALLAESSSARQQWLVFAREWLELAEADEAEQRADAATPAK
jgi:hypothetical protein